MRLLYNLYEGKKNKLALEKAFHFTYLRLYTKNSYVRFESAMVFVIGAMYVNALCQSAHDFHGFIMLSTISKHILWSSGIVRFLMYTP